MKARARIRLASIACAFLIVAMLGGCSGGSQRAGDGGSPRTLPRIEETASSGTASAAPEDLPGVDTSKLNDRTRATWWRLVSQLYSPCPDQAVSVAQCVKESRPCSACTPMASFLAARLANGETSVDAEAAAAIRFGPDVRTVELDDSPAKGPSDAIMTIVAWSDFECPACGRSIPLLHKFQEAHPKEVRFVHKYYPLEKHTNAKRAAMAAFAAGKQGKYWEMEQTLFENQESLAPAEINRYAQNLKLDMKRFADDMASRAAEETIARDVAQAEALGLRSTPFVLINGRPFEFKYFKSTDLEGWLATELQLRKK
jgi:protein-disulfide isomerase